MEGWGYGELSTAQLSGLGSKPNTGLRGIE